MEKEKTLSGLAWGSAAILLLITAIHMIMILFPQTVTEIYDAYPYITYEPIVKIIHIVIELRYVVIAVLAAISGIRRNFSLVWGTVTMVITAVVYLLPGRTGSALITRFIARYGGAEMLGSYSTMSSFTGSFSMLVTLAVWILIGCTAIEIYASWKNKNQRSIGEF